ncbi:hypothetical protein KIN20_036199 [Parelaphostrongylus tenuis]|uniref:DZF domain-containing protein n=1 Tax=Parelaphostrongylus tenuis TaxID=148309 RepID=A0AAD5RCV7_PARTN|nr:hypothetical protein KIN20_036199 [Parelaphostrongylus tenuis]
MQRGLLRFTDAAARPPPPGDALDKEACLKALAQLRHAKWFQVLQRNQESLQNQALWWSTKNLAGNLCSARDI